MQALIFLGKATTKAALKGLADNYEKLYVLTTPTVDVPHSKHIEVLRFDNFHNNGKVEIKAYELAKETPDLKVFGVSEGDVLRVSALNDILGNGNLSFDDALCHRNKLLMKNKASSGGISVPHYSSVAVPFDVLRFVEQHGLPVVVKPVTGSGGTNTIVIKSQSELEDALASRLFSYKEIAETYVIESFVEGDMYHVDGIIVNNELEAVFISCYRTSCLSFQEGKNLGSYMVDVNHPLFEPIKAYTKEVLAQFPFDTVSPFHLELFATPKNELVFCEIACRAGGGTIMETIEAVTGYRLDDVALQGQYHPEAIKPVLKEMSSINQLGGWLIVPPKAGTLEKIPASIPYDYVNQYLPNAQAGKAYSVGEKAADNILQVVVTGDTHQQVLAYLDEIEGWLSEEIKWS